MSDVFISYSRQDAAFVRNLHDALKAAKRESWVDWEGIPPSAEWMGEIQRAIAAADTFVFVVSHHSAASTVCRAEVEFATEQGKRIVPVVCSEPEIATVPDAVARLNWIFFRPEDPFSERFATLLNALDTDLEHVRAHTRILVRARTWTDHRQDSSYLLRGSDLETAERWLEASREKLPPVTPLQSRYLAESRRTQAQRQRRLLAGVAVALALSIALGVLAYLQRNAAIATRRNLSAALPWPEPWPRNRNLLSVTPVIVSNWRRCWPWSHCRPPRQTRARPLFSGAWRCYRGPRHWKASCWAIPAPEHSATI